MPVVAKMNDLERSAAAFAVARVEPSAICRTRRLVLDVLYLKAAEGNYSVARKKLRIVYADTGENEVLKASVSNELDQLKPSKIFRA